MRILIDGSGATLGAAGLTRLRELARTVPHLDGIEAVFVARPEVAPHLLEVDPGLTVWTVPPRWRPLPLRLLWQRLGLPRRARRFAPDVVFAPFNVAPGVDARGLVLMISNLAPYSAQVAARATRRQRLRNRALRLLTDRSVRRADRVILQSRQGLDLIDVPGLPEKAVVLPPPAPPPLPEAAPKAEIPDEPFLMAVGDLYSFKGVETAIDALARVADPPLLLVCGHPREPDYARSLERRADDVGVGDRVRLTGSLPHETVLALMDAALACVATSRFENFSRIPSEAMAVETPVLACDIPSYRDACGDAAAYYAEDDVEGLARLIERASADPAWMAELVARGRSRVTAEDSPSAAVVVMDALRQAAA